jgi:LysR family glycine cleavage system transcriptional activator
MASREKRISISIGEDTRSKNTRQEYLQSDSIFPVCSPTLLPSGSSLRHLDDLRMFELLDVSASPSDGAASDWTSWLSSCGEGGGVRKRTLRFGSSLLALQAAIAGTGVALARGWVAEPDLLAGSLVKPIDVEVSSEDPYYVVYHKGLENCEEVLCFREWLFDTVNSKNGAQASTLT